MDLHDIDDALTEAKREFDHGMAPYSPPALSLIRAAEAMREELLELRALFDLQQRRTAEATDRWRAEDPQARQRTLPDLGVLLQWLMDKADLAAGALKDGDGHGQA